MQSESRASVALRSAKQIRRCGFEAGRTDLRCKSWQAYRSAKTASEEMEIGVQVTNHMVKSVLMMRGAEETIVQCFRPESVRFSLDETTRPTALLYATRLFPCLTPILHLARATSKADLAQPKVTPSIASDYRHTPPAHPSKSSIALPPAGFCCPWPCGC